jgi:hypothetical protein
MAPLVRRGWAPRGQPPTLEQCGSRQKVSVAAALWLAPRRDRLGLYFHTLVDDYFNNWSVAAFLEAMLQDLAGRFVVIWDQGPMPKGDPIRQLTSRFANRLSLEDLPPWSPTLNPVDFLWGWLKYDRLYNYAPHDARELDGRAIAELMRIRDDQEFLKNLFHESELPLPRTLLT